MVVARVLFFSAAACAMSGYLVVARAMSGYLVVARVLFFSAAAYAISCIFFSLFMAFLTMFCCFVYSFFLSIIIFCPMLIAKVFFCLFFILLRQLYETIIYLFALGSAMRKRLLVALA